MSTATLDPQVVDLVERARAGDGEAFARLYDRYVDQVFGFVLTRVRDRDLAEDLTADVFLRALRSLPRFRWQGVDVGAWLLTIARNRVTDHFKSARARLVRTTDEVHDDHDDAPVEESPEDVALTEDMSLALAQAMALLKDEHREVLELRFNCSLSVSETAAAMDRTEGAIKALQYRALKSLASIVRDHPMFRDEVGV